MTEKRTSYLNWDDYFMATALLSSKRSKDPSTQVGAVIVDRDNRIVSIGYNGFPRGCDDDEFPWGKPNNDYEHKKMYVVHAEANAILNKNSANIKGMKLYTTLFPCNECAKLVVQSGITEIYYLSDKHEKNPAFRASKRMFDAVGIVYKQYLPTQKKITIDFEALISENKQASLQNGYKESASLDKESIDCSLKGLRL